MSTRSVGNRREDSVCRALEAFGYRTMCSRASGSKSVFQRPAGALCGDFIAIAPDDSGLPHLLGEVGGIGKRLEVTFLELTRLPLPGGFVPVVVRCVRRKWLWYASADDRYHSLGDMLEALHA